MFSFFGRAQVNVPPGGLNLAALDPRLVVHHGIPASASILAFDPLQRLLAVGSRDGRVKVYGGGGIEALLVSPSMAAIKFLQFLPNKGFLVTVTNLNRLEAWDLHQRVHSSLYAVLSWPNEVTCVAAIPDTHFLLVGDDQGTLSVVELTNDKKLKILEYNVPLSATMKPLLTDMSLPPSLVGILPQPAGPRNWVLLAYSNGILVLWDLHALKVVATRGGTPRQRALLGAPSPGAPKAGEGGDSEGDEEDEEDEVCTVCWACEHGAVAAAGYTSGDVSLWGFPVYQGKGKGGGGGWFASSKGKDVGRLGAACQEAVSGVPLGSVQLAGARGSKVPVTLVRWSADHILQGKAGTVLGGGRLFVLGGDIIGMPEAVSVVSLSSLDSGLQQLGVVKLPWFGPVSDILVVPSVVASPVATPPASPSLALPSPRVEGAPSAAVVVLTTPGQVHVHDDRGLEVLLSPGGPVGGGGVGKGAPPPKELNQGAVAQPAAFYDPGSAVSAARLASMSWDSHAARVLATLPWAPIERSPAVLSHGTRWPIRGGAEGVILEASAERGLRVYLSGHECGKVLISDVSTPLLVALASTPQDLTLDAPDAPTPTVPASAEAAPPEPSESDEAAPGGAPEDNSSSAADDPGTGVAAATRSSAGSPVSAVDFCPSSGLLAAGHKDGTVQLFQLWDAPRKAQVRVLRWDGNTQAAAGEGAAVPPVTSRVVEAERDPGLQCIAHLALHSAPVSAVALASAVGRLATGCAAGSVALLDLRTLSALALFHPSPPSRPPAPVASLAVVSPPAMSEHGEGAAPASATAPQGASPPLLLALSGSMCLAVADAESGAVLYRADIHGGTGTAVGLLLLDGTGVELPELKGQWAVPWVEGRDEESGGAKGVPMESITEDTTDAEAEGRDEAGEGGTGEGGAEAGASAEAESSGAPGEGREGGGDEPGGSQAEDAGQQTSEEKDGPGKEADDGAPHISIPDSRGGAAGTGKEGAPGIQTTGSKRWGRLSHHITKHTSCDWPGKAGLHSASFSAASAAAAAAAGGERQEILTAHKFEHAASLGALPVAGSDAVAPPPAGYLLVVGRNSLVLHSAQNIQEKLNPALKEAAILENDGVIWVGAFGVKGTFPPGLALFSARGKLEIRSLPDLGLVESNDSVSDYLGWPLESASVLRQTAISPDARLAILDGDLEMFRLSLLAEENALGIPESLPELYVPLDDSTAAQPFTTPGPGAEPEPEAVSPLPKTDAAAGKGSRLGVKRLFHSVKATIAASKAKESKASQGDKKEQHKDQSGHSVGELDLLFKAACSLGPPVDRRAPEAGKGGADDDRDDLDVIDDILNDIEASTLGEDEPGLGSGRSSSAPAQPKEGAQAIFSMFGVAPTGSAPDPKPKDARAQLLGTSSAPSGQPLTADDVRAKYGKPRKQSAAVAGAADAASQARDKLMERGQKLQDINKGAEDLASDAANFSKLAAQLAKKSERSWW